MTDSLTSISADGSSAIVASSIGIIECSECDYVVPEGQTRVDGIALGLKPGSVIGLSGSIAYKNLNFQNIVGTAEQPIIIKNCGGTARLDATGTTNGIKIERSKYVRITGGDVNGVYGIVVNGGHMSVNFGFLATNFEVDHIEIYNSGFAGIMAKTEPSCAEATWRENFLMENVDIHHNYVHNTGGEGIYAGSSWYSGMETACGVVLPHEIHNIRIFNNIFKDTGWEAIQLGCATKGASIHNNTIENYGAANKLYQNNGIQISSGTGGLCYNNLIKKGPGNGMMVFGLGDNIIFNNIIDQAGNFGIFCDERETPGPGFQFLNNTIINPASDGIRIFAELVPKNVIVNNIIANPGSYGTYDTLPLASAFVYKLDDNVKIEMANNFFTTDTDAIKIADVTQSNYILDATSPVIDKGADISVYYDILTDFYGHARRVGAGYDIGAVEVSGSAPQPPANSIPSVSAGSDKTVTLPDNSLFLESSASDVDGTIASYQWTKLSGGMATLSGTTTPSLHVGGLVAGVYTFQLTVTDDLGASNSDEVQVSVISLQNEPPVAYAGPNLDVILPQNSAILEGAGTDSDGSVVSYSWTQYGGTPVLITNAESSTATISGLTIGKYYFRLTVTDNAGATHYDNMLVRVEGNIAPVADAGPNVTVTLPETSVVLHGTGTDADGTIAEYAWTQYNGAPAVITGAHTASPTISGLTLGRYYFRLTVTDDNGATHYDNMLIRVEEPTTGTE